MTVAFNRMPLNLRVPLFYAEVNSGLSFYQSQSKVLLLGQKLSDGSATVNVQALVNKGAELLFGKGSMLAEMFTWARKQNPLGEMWAIPLADPSGVAATKTVTVAGTIAAGTLVLYVCGEKLQIPVLATDTVTTIAANIVAAINAGYTGTDGQGYFFPVSAANSAGVVTVTCRHVGVVGNDIAIDKDLVGDEGPLSALLTIAAGVTGTGTPSLASALAACGDQEFDYIVVPYADTTTLDAVQAFLSDSGGRWDPTSQLYGHAISCKFDTLSNLATLGTGRNDPHMTIMGVVNSPSPPWRWAAAIGGQVQLHKNLGADLTQAGEISRPMQTLVLNGIKPPKLIADAWERAERQTLYFDGISGYFVTPDRKVALDRIISTYRVNVWNQPDTTWLDIETLCQTVYAVRFIRQQITQKHPRDALVPDNPTGRQGFTTPNDLKADVVHAYALLVRAGIMKNLQLFADSVVVEQMADPNAVAAFLPFDVVNQLRIFAANAETALNRATV